MSLTDSMRILDAPPDNTFWDDSASDVAPKTCAEPGCMNPVGETPTGRKAKFCDAHKTAKDRSGAAPKTGARKTSRSTWAEKNAVRDSLNQLVFFGSAGLKVINKVDGEIVADGGPAIVSALVDLAETDKSIRRYLNFLSKPGKYGALTLAVAGVVIPVMANHGLLPTFFVDLTGNESGKTHTGGGVSE